MNVGEQNPKPYQLFHLYSPESHNNLDRAVKMLWCSNYKHKHQGPDDYLDGFFSFLHMHPGDISAQICPYYFDQVTDKLWKYHQSRIPGVPRCLNLCCFHSWSSLKEEISRAFLSTTEDNQTRFPFCYRSLPMTQDPKRILTSKQCIKRLNRTFQ
ncbi:unnamed protein product [Knipowitschia caucasica]|uniref:Uncharacterized protein n=1 Tax=Knipowitschia caucasica TaxID=637954 RepID=A0AAV2MEZ3_KNICA